MQSLLVDQLRDGVASRLVLIGVEGGDVASRARASRALATALASDTRFAFVTDGDPSRLDRERELVFKWRYLLSPTIAPEVFTAAGLRTALDEALRLLASPLAPLIKP